MAYVIPCRKLRAFQEYAKWGDQGEYREKVLGSLVTTLGIGLFAA